MSNERNTKNRFESLCGDEMELRRRGYRYIAGVDEAGRGPMAGPVVAAAVVLRPDAFIPLLDDSKKLAPRLREALFPDVLAQAVAVGIGIRSARFVDMKGIAEATYAAMRQAVVALARRGYPPELVLVDGNHPVPALPFPQETRVRGDSAVACIAAASIIAKVMRDRIMASYQDLYPEYGFGKHKGYCTADHRKNLERLGPCPIHRKSFSPVQLAGDVLDELHVLAVDEDSVEPPGCVHGEPFRGHVSRN